MVLKKNQKLNTTTVKWIGAHEPRLNVPHLQRKNAFFYSKCIIGPLTLSTGDFVLISNADSTDPDSVEGCDVAKILSLYELIEMSNRDHCRAIVQWYSRPECIPHKQFDNDKICIDFDRELIEEHRPYDSDISLETVFRKCSVICGPIEKSAAELLENVYGKSKNCIMFACRYKFIKVKNSYRLVPLQFAYEEMPPKSKGRHSTAHFEENKSSIKNSKRSPILGSEISKCKRRVSLNTGSTGEFIDLNYYSPENKVSPIKILGGRSVVRLSTKTNINLTDKSREKNNINGNYSPTSPLGEESNKVIPQLKAVAAKRNLNLSLSNSEANSTADSDCLNYSIVQCSPDLKQPLNEMKIKLRLSERRRSSRLASLEDNYQTPSKTSKEASKATPLNHRKSILKSAAKKIESTPRRSIQLPSIGEKYIFDGHEVINTPKRIKFEKRMDDFGNEEVDKEKDIYIMQLTPKKCKQKTYIKCKNDSATTTNTVNHKNENINIMGSGEVKPPLENRNIRTDGKVNMHLQIARERLHVSVVPTSLACREKEFENIYTFLQSKIEDQCSGCMYVSGVPGTGKTATVTGVIRSLQKKVAEDELPSFDFLEINGMRLTEPRQAYVHIYRQFTGKTLSWEHAHALLVKRFTTAAPRRITTVLLVDELDVLCNKRQDVVYNLLDWPTKSASRLVVVTIANTMDLPERLLMGKVTSRLGLTRLTFQPYTHKQLKEIVTDRLTDAEAFKSDAIQLVARKVAAVSGDARRALDICRRAIEIANADKSKTPDAIQCVNMLHVQQALAEMIASSKVQAIRNCSRLEQIFLQAIVAEVNRTGVEETYFLGVYSQIETMAAYMGVKIPTPGRALHICSKLGAERLLICEHSRNDIFQKILLNVSADDIHYALKVNN